MTTIALIGANGQVGTEVALFLRETADVTVVPICRTTLGSAFLRRCGFDVRHGAVSDPAQARALLAGVDLVADLSLPTGSTIEVRRAIEGLVTTAMTNAPAGVPYVYLSSVTAFGVPDFHSELRWYRLSQNQYGSCKRHGEHVTLTTATEQGRDGFVLRVGVVHGELQAVSRKVQHDIRHAGLETTFVPDAPSYTVFAFSIAEGLANIARGLEAPGTYTMLSSPAWSWLDLHRHFQRRTGVTGPVELIGPDLDDEGLLAAATGRVKDAVRSRKDFIGAYVTPRFPSLESRMRAVYHADSSRADIAAGEALAQYRPYGNNHSEFPGPRMTSLSDSRVSMEAPARRVREQLDEIAGPGPRRR